MKNCLGFIGGSGLYDLDFLEDKKFLKIKSDWGNSSDKIVKGILNGKTVFFLSRHGLGHKISPTHINYRANIDCLKQCGVTDIISLSAVGSLKQKLKPGTFVIIDQFIDRTTQRKNSFFNKGIIAHVPMTNPTSNELMFASKNCLDELNIKNVMGGTYLAIEGPHFSTKAESNLYRNFKSDVIGMTNMPEAKLSREAEIRYCSLSMVTDYDCWHENINSVTLPMIIKTMKENVNKSKNFIKKFIDKYYYSIDFSKDTTKNILDTSIITEKNYWDKRIKIKLNNILKRYNKDNK